MKKFNSPNSKEISSNYNIYNPSRFEGPIRVDNNIYLQGTFRSIGNSHNFSVPADNFTCNKPVNGDNICKKFVKNYFVSAGYDFSLER